MHTYAQNYLPQLRSYQHELLQRLELLVNIDSGTGQREGIDQVISHVQQWLSDIGFGLRVLTARSSFGNILHVDLAFPVHRTDPNIKSRQFLVMTAKTF